MDRDEDARAVFAGEYALGVLEGAERAAAQRLMLADEAFAEQVRWWSDSLAGMAEEAGSRAPGEQVWEAIERRLDPAPVAQVTEVFEPAGMPVRRGFSGWTLAGAMAGAAAIAAAVALVVGNPLAVPPRPVSAPAEAPERRLVAQAQSADGAISLASLVEQQAGRLSLTVSGLAPQGRRAPELWIVPAGGAPRSLGEIPRSGSITRDLSDEERRLLIAGSSLAVTYENWATIPNPAPTGEIVVLGSLSEV